MADNDKLIISELDFDQIKGNLKEYLRSQPEFSDYDFDGSGMSILLDVLAYNTYYGSYYDNVVANESRLHTAILRPSIVSKAKELGYVPKSRKAPVVPLSIIAKPKDVNSAPWNTTTNITLTRGKTFSTMLNGKSYDYVTLEDYVLIKNGAGNYVNPTSGNPPATTPVYAYEGKLKTASFIVDNQDQDRKYIIPTSGVDSSTVRIFVRRSINETEQTEYFPASTFSTPDGANNAYWLWENNDFKYEIEFGDGVLGKKLKDGNVVIVEYLVTQGSVSNGCRNYRLNSSIAGLTNVDVVAINKSFGGAEAESLESIKFNAPRAYSMQNRAVIEDDYEFLIKQEFPAAQSVIVWGGENNDPPQYGRVFVSIKVDGVSELTLIEKDYITSLIKKYNMVTINPVIVDPDYILLILDVSVIFDRAKTTKTDAEIKQLVSTTIDNFNDDVIGKFRVNYRHSQLTGSIDDSDSSIVSNLVKLKLQKFYYPILGVSAEYTLNFKDALVPTTIIMDGFSVTEQNPLPNSSYKITDDGNGILNLIRVRPDVADNVIGQAGSVDYPNGIIKIQNFNPTSIFELQDYRRTEYHTITTVDTNVNGYIQLDSDIVEGTEANIIVSSGGIEKTNGVDYIVDDNLNVLEMQGLNDNPPKWQVGEVVEVTYDTTRQILRVTAEPVDEDVVTSQNTIIEISEYTINVSQGRG